MLPTMTEQVGGQAGVFARGEVVGGEGVAQAVVRVRHAGDVEQLGLEREVGAGCERGVVGRDGEPRPEVGRETRRVVAAQCLERSGWVADAAVGRIDVLGTEAVGAAVAQAGEGLQGEAPERDPVAGRGEGGGKEARDLGDGEDAHLVGRLAAALDLGGGVVGAQAGADGGGEEGAENFSVVVPCRRGGEGAGLEPRAQLGGGEVGEAAVAVGGDEEVDLVGGLALGVGREFAAQDGGGTRGEPAAGVLGDGGGVGGGGERGAMGAPRGDDLGPRGGADGGAEREPVVGLGAGEGAGRAGAAGAGEVGEAGLARGGGGEKLAAHEAARCAGGGIGGALGPFEPVGAGAVGPVGQAAEAALGRVERAPWGGFGAHKSVARRSAECDGTQRPRVSDHSSLACSAKWWTLAGLCGREGGGKLGRVWGAVAKGLGGALTRHAAAVGNSEQFFGAASSPRVAGRRSVEAAVFRTITSVEWAVAIARARAEENVVRARIRAAVEKRRAAC